VPGAPGPGDRVSERETGADPASRDSEAGQVQHGARRDGGRQGQRQRHPGPVPIVARVGPDGKLEPQQRPPRVGRRPLESNLLPVAGRQRQHPRRSSRGLQFEHVPRQSALCVKEPQGLPCSGLDHSRRNVLPTGEGRADRVPLLRRALVWPGGPGREDRAGQSGPPGRGPQQAPGLLLRHPDDPVIDRDPLWNRSGPAEAAQPHQGSAPGDPLRHDAG
jgi:hypothetical protein